MGSVFSTYLNHICYHWLIYVIFSCKTHSAVIKLNTNKTHNSITNVVIALVFTDFQKWETNYWWSMERGIQSMSDAHGLCLQDFVSAGTNNGTNNDHLHNHHNLHDSVSSAVSVSSAITGLMSSGNNSLNHLSHDTTNHHHHHHSLSNTPTLHEPLEKLKRKFFVLFEKNIDIFFIFFLGWMQFTHEIPKIELEFWCVNQNRSFLFPFLSWFTSFVHTNGFLLYSISFSRLKWLRFFPRFVLWVAIVCMTWVAGHPNSQIQNWKLMIPQEANWINLQQN